MLRTITFLLLCVTAPKLLLADLILTHQFTGAVTSIDEDNDGNSVNFGSGLSIGDSFLMTLQYNLAASDANMDPNIGEYVFNPAGQNGVSFVLPTFSVFTDPTGVFAFNIANDSGFPLSDSLNLPLSNDYTITGISASLALPSFIAFRGGPDALPDDGLPSAFDLTKFDSRRVDLALSDGTDAMVLSASLDSVTTTAVPEPSSLALLGIGAVGMAVVRRRRKKRVAA